MFINDRLISLFHLIQTFLLLCASVITLCQHICLLHFQIIWEEILTDTVHCPAHCLCHSLRSVIMPFYQTGYLADRIIIEFQPAQDLCSHLFSRNPMHLEMISSILICFPDNRLSNVMKQHGNPENFICTYMTETVQDMLSYCVTVVRRILRCCHTCIKLRKKFSCDPGFISHPEIIRMRRHQELHKLYLNPLCADMLQIRCQNLQCLTSLFFNGKAQLRTETDCTHDPQCILCKTLQRVSHTADDSSFNILQSAEKVHQS